MEVASALEAMSQSEPFETQVFERLDASGMTIAVAESCTGGLIAHRLTNVPGVSACFLGGIVAYSNEAKVGLLGVTRADLDAHGAVSELVARQMAEGVRERFGADIGVGVTGIAGPGGATPGKPVGLVYVAVSSGAETTVRRHEFPGPREAVKAQSADEALSMVLERIS